jgi:hypothetical protein
MPAADITVNVELYSMMAGGGTVNFVDEGGTIKEVHTFTYNGSGNQTNYSLTFPAGVVVDGAQALVVAGGGGGGGTSKYISENPGHYLIDIGMDTGGGGGGGGVIYPTQTISGTVSVSVGGGGGSGWRQYNGANGVNSVFGTLTAIGGGGGGGGGNTGQYQNGRAGGSSGGAGAVSLDPGISPNPSVQGQGNKGGISATSNVAGTIDGGGGGGGAGSAGTNGTGGEFGQPGLGGAPRVISGIPFHGSLSVSPGGDGGYYYHRVLTAADMPQSPTLYGGGGTAGTGGQGGLNEMGAAGKEGIVIVWWNYVAP